MSEAWKQYEGQVVDGRFHLRQYVGASDHSAVFLTENGQQKVAIKFIPAEAASSDRQILRWQQTAKLSHPHLIQIFHMGRCHLGGRDLLYVVTEFAEENLSQILPHRALTAAEAGDMLPPVLDALGYLHGKSLLHGHLKPSNVMAVRDQLKLSSDGLCAVGEAVKDPQTLGIYSAPEAPKGMTPASDVWSLGMTLVEVLTQRPFLWDGSSSMKGEPVVPETVPAPFRNIASHCLRQDPQRRWTLAEIAAGLTAPVNGSQKAAVVESSELASSGPLNKSRWVGPVVAIVVLIAAIVGAAKLLDRPSTTAPSEVVTSPPSTDAVDTPKTAIGEPVKPAPAETEGSSRATRRSPSSGSVVQQVLPDLSSGARRTVQGKIKIRVRVDVDTSGNVVGSHLESAGPSKYFAGKSVEAARRWKFVPAQVNGQPVASVWVLQFAISRRSTSVQSARTKP